jgi:hypothetical protein
MRRGREVTKMDWEVKVLLEMRLTGSCTDRIMATGGRLWSAE